MGMIPPCQVIVQGKKPEDPYSVRSLLALPARIRPTPSAFNFASNSAWLPLPFIELHAPAEQLQVLAVVTPALGSRHDVISWFPCAEA